MRLLKKKSKSFQQKYSKEKSNAFYYKNKAKHLTSKMKKQNQIVPYFLVEKNVIQTFEDGK